MNNEYVFITGLVYIYLVIMYLPPERPRDTDRSVHISKIVCWHVKFAKDMLLTMWDVLTKT